MSELRQAMRALCRVPGTTALSIVTLGLGIAAATTAFSAVYAALLRPIPFSQPDRLAYLHTTRQTAAEGLTRLRWSYSPAGEVRAHATSFASMATFTRASIAIGAAARAGAEEHADRADEGFGAEQIDGEVVSAGYFETLRVAPSVGRVFAADEEAPGLAVAVIGDGLWRRRYGADPAIATRTVIVNGVPLAIIGVMPAGFEGVSGRAMLWIPAGMAPSLTYRDYLTTPQLFINLIGRLKDGVTFARANAELDALARGLPHQVASGAPPARWGAAAMPLGEARVDPRQRRALLLLLAASAGVLVVTCVNSALLQLTRARARRGEMAIRLALGASRGKLARQALAESALVAAAGGVAGSVVAAWGVAWLRRAAPGMLPSPLNAYGQVSSFSTPSIDAVSLLCVMALCALTTALAGLAPAVATASADPASALAQVSRGLAGRTRKGALSGLVMTQIATAVLMLSGAFLLARTVRHLEDGRSAFDGRVVSFWIDAPASRYANADGPAIVQRLLDRITRVPGVLETGVNRCTPFTGCARTTLFMPGRSTRPSDAPVVGRHYVSPGYFHVVGIPLRRGRLITDDDRAGRPPVAVINETAARRFWPGEDPIGKHVWFGPGSAFMDPAHPLEIVGVVADVKYWPPNEPVGPDFYTSYLQFVWPSSLYVVKTADAATVLPAIRRAVADLDPALAVSDVRRIDERIDDAVAPARFIAVVTGLFACSAAALAALGVFGVMAYSVSTRREELAVRLALGASPAALNRGVLRDAAQLAIAGSACGAIAGLWLLPLTRALLYGVSPGDPVTIAVAAGAMTIVAVLAAAVPAWRASAVDPLTVLRR